MKKEAKQAKFIKKTETISFSRRIGIMVICLAIAYLTAFLGSVFTSPNVDSDWYNTYKPSLTPPNWVFPVVWNILFLLIALSIYFIWMSISKISSPEEKSKAKRRTLEFYAINLVFNIFWSIAFFEMKDPLVALYCLAVIWLSLFLLIISNHKYSRLSAWLLVPYLLWISFAAVLNILFI